MRTFSGASWGSSGMVTGQLYVTAAWHITKDTHPHQP